MRSVSRHVMAGLSHIHVIFLTLPPRWSISVSALYRLAALGSLKARLTEKDAQLSLASVRIMRAESDVDHSKATRELGWEPRPVEESIREAARFWTELRNAKGKNTTAG